MVVLPRLARRLNSPAIATLLAIVLIGVGIFGIATDDIGTGYAVVVMIVGLINLIRALPYGPDLRRGDSAGSTETPRD